MPIRTGQQFIERLDRMGSAIWIDGERIEGPVSRHPAFAGVIRTKAALYDAQHDPARIERMTYRSPATGERVGLSYLPPRTKEELAKRRLMSREWALIHGGWMGRSPDYTNTALMAFASAAPLFGSRDAVYGDRIRDYYEYCRDHDLSLAHTLIRPPADRRRFDADEADDFVSLSVVETNAEGLIVSGARHMVTQGGITDELLVFPSYVPEIFAREGHPLAFAFAIPSDTPNVTFIGRRPYGPVPADAPLASRLDEIDAIVRFDRVLVPWERVFAYGDIRLANRLYDESGFYPHTMHQVVTRLIAKTEFFHALMRRMADMFELSGTPHVREAIADCAGIAESLRALQESSETAAAVNRWGVCTPDERPLYAALRLYGRSYAGIIAALQRIGGSHLIANASEGDLASDYGDWLRVTLAAPDPAYDGAAKSRLSRLAWDACASAFAARQSVYELYFYGDPARLGDRLLDCTDAGEWETRLDSFLTGGSGSPPA